MPVAVSRLEADGTVAYANAAAARLVGRPGGSWREAVAPGDREALAGAIRRAREGVDAVAEVRFVRSDHAGGPDEVHLYAAAGDGAPFAVVLDAAPRSALQEARLQSDAVSRIFVEQSPVGMLHLDAAGTVTFENHPFRQIVGEGADDAWIGQRIDDVPGLSRALRTRVRRMLADGTLLEGEAVTYGEAAGPSQRRLVFHGSPIRHPEEGILGGVLMVEDRTEQWMAEEALREAKRQAESASRLKTAFIATMSHEIRTPMGAVNGFAELLSREMAELQADVSLPPQLGEFAEAIRENSQKLLTLVNDLFDLSNLEAGTIEVRRRPVPLHDALTRAAGRVAGALAEKGVDLHLALDAEDPAVMADPQRLEQIFDNLLSNAAKFTDEGSVTVRTARRGGEVVVEVADTGVGIAAAYRERLFTPLMQEDSRLNRRFQGTGLGLALVKRLVDVMEGAIEVESEKGEGSTFRLRLPAAAS